MGEFRYPEAQEMPEALSATKFRDIYTDVLRILEATNTPALMSFGPSVLELDGALAEGFIDDPKEFKPQLKATSVGDIDTEIEGSTYTAAEFFFKLGGNISADKKWLGNIQFVNSDEWLRYEFHTNGTIKMTRSSMETRWISNKLVRQPEGEELASNLEYIKQLLHWSQTGKTALRAVA